MPQPEAILARVEGKKSVIPIGDFHSGPDTGQHALTGARVDDALVLSWTGVDRSSVDFEG